MTQQTDAAYRLPHDKKQILAIFEMYRFQDKNGLPLTNCVDFLQLVDAFCAEGEEDRPAQDAGE